MEQVESSGDYKLHRAFKPVNAKYKGTEYVAARQHATTADCPPPP
jgi:hypothetical protein